MLTALTVFLTAVLLGILFSIVGWSLRNGISPMPSSKKQRAAIRSLVPDNFHGRIVELGSGWGTLSLYLGARFSSATVIGYETSWIPFCCSVVLQRLLPVNNLQLKRQDFFEVPLRGADLVVCYLYPKAMRSLREKLQRELAPGTIVISNTFGVHEWNAEKVIAVNDIFRSSIYMYRIS